MGPPLLSVGGFDTICAAACQNHCDSSTTRRLCRMEPTVVSHQGICNGRYHVFLGLHQFDANTNKVSLALELCHQFGFYVGYIGIGWGRGKTVIIYERDSSQTIEF